MTAKTIKTIFMINKNDGEVFMRYKQGSVAQLE